MNQKCVMIVDGALPLGIIANTCAVMGATLGKFRPDAVGPSVADKSGNDHLGIIQIPIPILKADKETLKTLRTALFSLKDTDLTVIDFSDIAQKCKTYEEYIARASGAASDSLSYLGLCIYGNAKQINKLTGSMPLLR